MTPVVGFGRPGGAGAAGPRCRAELYIGDDYGDNEATMRCALPAGHEGHHEETWARGPARAGAVRVTWERDERRPKVTERWQESREAAREACRCGHRKLLHGRIEAGQSVSVLDGAGECVYECGCKEYAPRGAVAPRTPPEVPASGGKENVP